MTAQHASHDVVNDNTRKTDIGRLSNQQAANAVIGNPAFYSSRMVMPKPPERAMRSFMTVLAVTFLRVMV